MRDSPKTLVENSGVQIQKQCSGGSRPALRAETAETVSKKFKRTSDEFLWRNPNTVHRSVPHEVPVQWRFSLGTLLCSRCGEATS